MNSLDDFARLRSAADDATAPDLDAIWTRAVEASARPGGSTADPPAGHTHAPPVAAARPGNSRRRLALGGAAASLLIGIIAVAAVSNRVVAPDQAVDTSAEPVGPPSVTPTTEPVSVEAGPPPRWDVAAAGWELVSFDDAPIVADDVMRLFAGPDGLARSWVAVVEGVSEPLIDDGVEAADLRQISSQRIATDDGSFIVIGGGVADDVALSVFRASQEGAALPEGFVETSSSVDAAMRTVRYEFAHGDGETIVVDVQGAGVPRFETELASATAEEVWEDTHGADDARIAYVGEYTLLVRNGFWVTRITTSAPPDSPDTFTRLARLVQQVTESDSEAPSTPSALPDEMLALGDSVLLGAARELSRAGFVVDADESRSFDDGLEMVRSLRRTNRLPSTVVIALGANARIGAERLDEMLDLVADVDTVVLVTTHVDRDRFDSGIADALVDNNEVMRAAADAQPNVAIADWDAAAPNCPGDCLALDGLHLMPDGRRFYADLVVAAAT